jgi:hypothetical protein
MTTPGATDDDAVATPVQFSDVCFKIGAVDQLAGLRAQFPIQPEDADGKAKFKDAFNKSLADMQVRIGVLLKTDTVSFLFGAGASKDSGGVLLGSIPTEIEKDLIQAGVSKGTKPRIRKWLRYFYTAAKWINPNDSNIPHTHGRILQRRDNLSSHDPTPIVVNYESLLSLLHRWRAAMQEKGGHLRIGADSSLDLTSAHLDECLRRATRALAHRCCLPVQGKERELEAYGTFARKVLTRPLNLKRVNVFTLNYDTLVEQAADAEGVVLIDGFVGTLKRIFRPECYDQDLYFPAETTEGRVHRHDRVVHLYKLHGSITWVASKPEWDNPYGLVAKTEMASESDRVMVYPTPGKFGETLGMPYAELFRRFASAVVRPQSTLFVVGYGFGDDHVNAIIRQAVVVPSFTLVIIDPNPRSDFVRTLLDKRDQRVWIFSGQEIGSFSRFVQNALPDLRDEEVRQKVISTYRALGLDTPDPREVLPNG